MFLCLTFLSKCDIILARCNMKLQELFDYLKENLYTTVADALRVKNFLIKELAMKLKVKKVSINL